VIQHAGSVPDGNAASGGFRSYGAWDAASAGFRPPGRDWKNDRSLSTTTAVGAHAHQPSTSQATEAQSNQQPEISTIREIDEPGIGAS